MKKEKAPSVVASTAPAVAALTTTAPAADGRIKLTLRQNRLHRFTLV
jgi:hypothetical protein